MKVTIIEGPLVIRLAMWINNISSVSPSENFDEWIKNLEKQMLLKGIKQDDDAIKTNNKKDSTKITGKVGTGKGKISDAKYHGSTKLSPTRLPNCCS
uniref:Uncharacterized protein n=1 Tax=Romanomermis culicivorax TaxID=13658 RepID=A0A915HH06_ROMCU